MTDITLLRSGIDSQRAKSLNDLPNELLLQIFSYVDAHREDRILGHVPDDPPPNPPDSHLINDFCFNNESLRNLSLTCKSFHPLAQEQLLYAIPLGGICYEYPNEIPQTILVCLLRTLLAHHGCRQHVKQLRLCLPFYGRDYLVRGKYVQAKKSVQADKLMRALNLPSQMKERWLLQMNMSFERALIDLLLALTPRLERLCLSQNPEFTQAELSELSDAMHDPFVLESERPYGVTLQGFQGLTIAYSLTYLKVVSLLPMKWAGLDSFPNLRTLDISTKLANLSQQTVRLVSELYASPGTREALRNIHHLRLDFQIKSVGIWDTGARVCLNSILQAVHGVKSLDCYAEPSDSKNPFRSVRAFPHYQANIQNYPDNATEMDARVRSQEYWDRRIYDARTEITDYQNLVDAIVHLRPRLESLRLPGGFWALPGAMRKPLPRFDGFMQLRRLIVPQAAVTSIRLDNMRFDEVKGDFELEPRDVLPPLLEYLKIFDADVGLLEERWLEELFVEQKNFNRWPGLVRLELLFEYTCGDIELEELIAKKSQHKFWAWASEATFKVSVGRDDEVPSVCV